MTPDDDARKMRAWCFENVGRMRMKESADVVATQTESNQAAEVELLPQIEKLVADWNHSRERRDILTVADTMNLEMRIWNFIYTPEIASLANSYQPKDDQQDEVSAALAELRELFPNIWHCEISRVSYIGQKSNRIYTRFDVHCTDFEANDWTEYGATLSEAMQSVREWADSYSK